MRAMRAGVTVSKPRLQQRELARPQVDRIGHTVVAARLARPRPRPCSRRSRSASPPPVGHRTGLGYGLAGWPVGFFITALVTVCYVVTRFMRPRHTARSAPVIVVDSEAVGTA